jgi:flavin reductase (DIM6/NTAB) family NADH-FMN oxidoreductase RutF
MDILPGCASYIQLKLLSTHEAGDHDVALCEVLGTGVWNVESKNVVVLEDGISSVALDSTCALYTAQLRQEGII